MNELQSVINNKINKLEQIINHADRYIENAPEGTLRISHNKNTEQYFWRKNKRDPNGQYIKKNNRELIHALAQKDYEQRLRHIAEKEKIQLQHMRDEYHSQNLMKVYEDLSSARQKLIQPYRLNDREFIDNWIKREYENKSISDEDGNGIYTENGEVVRSKSEKIIADKLHFMDIPYHYEEALYLNGYGVIYPDFTILNVRTREVFYWEHFGIMDDKQYCEKAIRKIETMEKNHIFPGKQLIITYETQRHPLNARVIELLIQEHLA